MIKKIIYALVAICLFVLARVLLKGDFLSFLQWWAAVAFIGIVFMPLTTLIFANFHDKGYLFSKSIGIAITGYLMWLLSSLRIMKFTEYSSIFCVVISILFNCILLFFINRKTEDNQVGNSLVSSKRLTIDHIICEELLFLGLFLLFTYIRGFKPEAYGTEKFMDYGFMTSMMRSDYMPPQDFWFSGTKINYYYVGQFLATYLTKLSFVKVSSGYNLMLMMVGALAVVLPYSLVYNIALGFIKEREKKSRVIPYISGLIAGLGVCIAGNMHYPTYQWFEGAVRKFFGMEASTDKYWFPDATRFIGYHPETTDKTIHEFPAYSFVLGDLHAHVINIMFVLTVLGILYAWMCRKRENKDLQLPIWKEVLNPSIVLITFFIGIFHTTNYWDFPIYFVVAGAVILFTNMVVYNFKGKALGVTALQGLMVFTFSMLVVLPFIMNFDTITTSPALTVARTPLNQLIILWGLPIFMVIAFLCFSIANFRRVKIEAADAQLPKRKLGLFRYMETLPKSDLFIITLGLCAIGLVIIPEIIYIQDIYNGDYKRANTMFKLTYQAFIMFGICFGYIFMRLLCYGETRKQRKYAIVGLTLFILSVCYIQNAVNGWYGNIFKMKNYKGLDASAFMDKKMPDDSLAIDWLNENVEGMPVVLEANGDSYTDYQRISVMTGLPTVLGWRTHEWLWKSDEEIVKARAADVEAIYTLEDKTKVKELVNKYKISYIYVGKLELDKFTSINHTLLKSLGEVVFSSPATNVKTYETYIVKIHY